MSHTQEDLQTQDDSQDEKHKNKNGSTQQNASEFFQKTMEQANTTKNYSTSMQSIRQTETDNINTTDLMVQISNNNTTNNNTNQAGTLPTLNEQQRADFISDTSSRRFLSTTSDIIPIIISYDNEMTIEWKGISHVIPKAYQRISKRSDSIDISDSASTLHEEKKLENEHKKYESWTEQLANLSSSKLFRVAESGEALAYVAAGYGATITATVGAALLASVSQHGYTKYLQWEADDTFSKIESYNAKVALLNGKIDIVMELQYKIDKKKQKLMKHEQLINKIEFVVERSFANAKVIVAIGPTGYGKSLFCNRMIGNQKDIETISESESEVYTVAEEGDTGAGTTEVQKVIRQIQIIESNTNTNNNNTNNSDDEKYVIIDKDKDDEKIKNINQLQNNNVVKKNHKKNITTQLLLSVVDTQGAFDTNNNDEKFQNQMAEYFRACGGVNMFCIFFKFKNKIDSNYQRLLKEYEMFWGKQFWKHCVIIITNCDVTNSEKQRQKLNKKLAKFTIPQVKQFLKKVSNGLCIDIPIFCFGESNYNSSTKSIIQVLANNDAKNVFSKKYLCQNILCPMDTLWQELQAMFMEYKKLLNEVKTLHNEIESLQQDKKVSSYSLNR